MQRDYRNAWQTGWLSDINQVLCREHFVRILIIKPSSLGDIIHTFPAAYALQQAVPNLRLSWVVNDSFAGILSLLPGVDRVIPFPRKKIGQLNWTAFRNFRRELQAESYDMAIDFQGLLRSGLIAWLSKAPVRAGFSSAREGSSLFYHQKIHLPPELKHAVDKNLYLVQELFHLQQDKIPAEPELTVQKSWLEEGLKLLNSGERPVLAVGFSSRWPSKTWPRAFFVAVLKEIIAEMPEIQCWLLGSPGERDEGEKLRQEADAPQITNLAGRTTMETLVGLLKQSNGLLTNDSGPMHIAAALKIPCIALFGATDPELTGPYGTERNLVVRSKCPQAPCFKRNCPRGNGELCTDGISPAEVAAQVVQRIQQNIRTKS